MLHHLIGWKSRRTEHRGIPTDTARSRLRLGMQKLKSRTRVREIARARARNAEVSRLEAVASAKSRN